MSLFATIQQSANALQVSELGLHVVGNNIANANTPGYLRQELVQTSGPGVRMGDTILGYGVRAVGVRQKIDSFVTDQMRQTNSSLNSSELVSNIYSQLESIFGELTDSDLSSQLNEFSSGVQDLINQPGNEALRRLVIERGKTLTANVRTLDRRLSEVSQNLNGEVQTAADEINRLSGRIATVNRRIVELEGGRTSGSDAVGLRDERLQLLQELSGIVNIRAVEQQSGAVTVFVGGEYLVADGIQRQVKFALRSDGEENIPEVQLADTNSPLSVTAGRLHGLYSARDGAIGRTVGELDSFAQNLIEQFNLIHSQGQGLKAFSSLTSTNGNDDVTGPLDLAGYATTMQNGEFEIVVHDLETGLNETHVIRVKLTGGTDDSSLEDVRQAINDISGLSASLTLDGRLAIEANNQSIQFSFQNDSANFLAASGMNTFFVGDSAGTIDINETIAQNPAYFAASLTGVNGGTENGVRLAQAFDTPLASLGNRSLKQNYEDIVVRMTQDVDVHAGAAEGLRNFYRTLEARHLGISGVNLDEEAVKMIFYQRAFQASSRLIQASSEMLEVLTNL